LKLHLFRLISSLLIVLYNLVERKKANLQHRIISNNFFNMLLFSKTICKNMIRKQKKQILNIDSIKSSKSRYKIMSLKICLSRSSISISITFVFYEFVKRKNMNLRYCIVYNNFTDILLFSKTNFQKYNIRSKTNFKWQRIFWFNNFSKKFRVTSQLKSHLSHLWIFMSAAQFILCVHLSIYFGGWTRCYQLPNYSSSCCSIN